MRDDMQALAARGFDVTFDSGIQKPHTNLARSLDHGVPAHSLSGVEVEDQRIRMLDILNPRAPRMDFEDIGLNEIDEPAKVVDDNGFSFRVLFGNTDDFNRVGQTGKRVLLEETFPLAAIRAAHQRKRPFDDVRENVIGDLGIIFGKAEFGYSLSFPQYPVGMGELYASKLDGIPF